MHLSWLNRQKIDFVLPLNICSLYSREGKLFAILLNIFGFVAQMAAFSLSYLPVNRSFQFRLDTISYICAFWQRNTNFDDIKSSLNIHEWQ